MASNIASRHYMGVLSIMILLLTFFSAPGWGDGVTSSLNSYSVLMKGFCLIFPLLFIFIGNLLFESKLFDSQFAAMVVFFSPLLVFSCYGALTVFWSPFPYLSAVRSISLSLVIVSCVAICINFVKIYGYGCNIKLHNSVFYVSAIYILLILVLALTGYKSLWRYDGRLGGVIIPTNTLGAFSSIVVGMSIIRIFSCKFFSIDLFFCLSSFACSYLCFSRGAIVSLFFSLCLVFAWEKLFFRRLIRLHYYYLTVIMLFLLLLLLLMYFKFDHMLTLLSRDGYNIEDIKTATSRSILWAKMIEGFGLSILTGYGYSAVSESGFVSLYSFVTNHAHNGYLQVLLGTGLIGFYFFVKFLFRVSIYMHLFFYISPLHWRLVFFLFSFFIINNLTEASIGYQVYPQFVILCLHLGMCYCQIKEKYFSENDLVVK